MSLEDLELQRNAEMVNRVYDINETLNEIQFPLSNEMKNNIAYEIEKIKIVCKCDSYIEAIVILMDVYAYEYDTINKILSPTILNKLHNESLHNGALKESKDLIKNFDILKWC